MAYVIKTPSGKRVGGGTSSRIVLPAGDRVSIHVPSDLSGALTIDPTAWISKPQLSNRVTTDIKFGGQTKALEAHLTVPAAQPFFGGYSGQLGPLYDQSYPIATLPTIPVWKDTWNVAGFNRVRMPALSISPS